MAHVTDDLRPRAPLQRKLLFAAAGVVLGTAALSLTCAGGSFNAGAGDESPIWVKGGSISLELLQRTNKWEKQDSASSKKWKIKNGNRGSDNYQLVIATSQPSKCTSLTPSGPTVMISYSDGNETITFSIANGKTALDSKQDLRTNGDRTLTYDVGGQGFIQKIEVGSDKCEYTERDPQLVFVLLDK